MVPSAGAVLLDRPAAVGVLDEFAGHFRMLIETSWHSNMDLYIPITLCSCNH